MASKNKLSTLGFTLIELLVVISIIGLISTIVLVSTKGSRDKARLAKVKQFSSQVSHALGAYAVGIWRFEEGEGIDIHDESGYGNHGTFHGNPTPVFPDGVYSGTTALQFDGVDDYVDCGNDESLDITNEITISAWVKPVLDSDFRAIVAHDMWYHWGMRKESNNKVYCHMRYSDGSRCTSLYIPTLTAEWQHIAFTWDKTVASNNAKAYKNGVLVDIETCGVGLDLHASRYDLNIGANHNSEHFNGTIDEVRIYNRALSAAEIRKYYAAGAAKHGIAINDK